MSTNYPKRLKFQGIDVEVHAEWCPIEKMRAQYGETGMMVTSDLVGAAALRCRCHLRPVEAPK